MRLPCSRAGMCTVLPHCCLNAFAVRLRSNSTAQKVSMLQWQQVREGQGKEGWRGGRAGYGLPQHLTRLTALTRLQLVLRGGQQLRVLEDGQGCQVTVSPANSRELPVAAAGLRVLRLHIAPDRGARQSDCWTEPSLALAYPWRHPLRETLADLTALEVPPTPPPPNTHTHTHTHAATATQSCSTSCPPSGPASPEFASSWRYCLCSDRRKMFSCG